MLIGPTVTPKAIVLRTRTARAAAPLAAIALLCAPWGDGARVLALALEGFGPGARAAFSIDVDDDLADSVRGRTQVVGAEIGGATVVLETLAPAGERRSAAAAFDADAVARVCA